MSKSIQEYKQLKTQAVDKFLSFSASLPYRQSDPDGFDTGVSGGAYGLLLDMQDALSGVDHMEIRNECWAKFYNSPFVGPATRDKAGTIIGENFRVTSKNRKIKEKIKQISTDYRNQLHKKQKQYITHKFVTGELFFCLTVHENEDFVEIDYINPNDIRGIGQHGCGIVFHPFKTNFPILYQVVSPSGEYQQVPSINVAYNPDMLDTVRNESEYKHQVDETSLGVARAKNKKKFKSLGGFKRFIISWEPEILASRAISYLKSVILWDTLYTMMKLVEVDHKRAMATYAWVASPQDENAWELWNSLTDDQKAQTGLISPKPPGSTLITPYGWTMTAVSPQLPQISSGDFDLQELLVAGLNLPNDVVTGTSKGSTFGSVKESRGPWADRIKNDQYDAKIFIKDLWGGVFFLLHKIHGFPRFFKVKEAVDFDPETKEPIFEEVNKKPEEMLTVNMPVFSAGNFDSQVKGLLGVKAGPLDDRLGVPKETISRRLGFTDYKQMRLRKATEDIEYPDLKPNPDATAGEERDAEKWLESGDLSELEKEK